MLTWAEGLPITIALLQNSHCGDMIVNMKTPLFFNGPSFLSCGGAADDRMMKPRFNIFELACPIPDTMRKDTPPCQSCFATWVLSNALGRPVPAPVHR